MTFTELLDGYSAYLQPKASWEHFRNLRRQYFTQWTEHPTFAQLDEWHRSHQATPHQANKGLCFLKAMYFWAMRRGAHPGPNPTLGIRQHKTFSRERVMTAAEVMGLLSARPMMRPKLSALLLVLLTTGCRLSEALRIEPEHVDFITGYWIQPRTKNHKPHVTYLPTQARAALAELPHGEDYVFEGTYQATFSVVGAEKAWGKVRPFLGLADVRLHDFRRTLATHLYNATTNEYLVKRCINHHNPSVTAIYVRISNEAVAQALQAQADRFFALAPPRPEVAVVPPDPPTGEPIRSAPLRLSKRETEVYDLLAQGRPAKVIARRLRLSIGAVNTYRVRLMEKLHLNTQGELIRFAHRQTSGPRDGPIVPVVSSHVGPWSEPVCVGALREEWPG